MATKTDKEEKTVHLSREQYNDEWRMLTKLEAKGYHSFNKAMLLLSSGAFITALVILQEMHNPNYLFFLVYAWVFWIVTILLQLASFSMYPKLLHQEKEQLLKSEASTKPQNYSLFMQRLSMVATIGFGMGVFFFIIFVLYNLNCF